MKALNKLIVAICFIAAIAGCKKDKGEEPAASSLVKEVALTYTYSGSRKILPFDYDEQGRLITGGFVYNTGGIARKFSFGSQGEANMDVSLDNGRIRTVHYNDNRPLQTEDFISTFTYDENGRLVQIYSYDRSLTAPYALINIYTYTWDDNDNLIEAKREFSRNVSGAIENTYTTTYSDFSPEYTNTLTGKNFGFDYFGTTSYPDNFTPNSSGSTGNTFPPVFAGKNMPLKMTVDGRNYEMSYRKDNNGRIIHIEQQNLGDIRDNVIYDISYR